MSPTWQPGAYRFAYVSLMKYCPVHQDTQVQRPTPEPY